MNARTWAVKAAVVAVLAYGLFAGLHTVNDFDTGWQLAGGRYVAQHHQIPSVDVLSYTTPGTRWLYPPFSGLLLYGIFHLFGYAGLCWFCALACLAVVAMVALQPVNTPKAENPDPAANSQSPDDRLGQIAASALLTFLAVPAIAYRTGARADLFTTAFFAIFLVVLWSYHCGARRRLWLLPVVMSAWVNLHPGFVAGLALLVAYLVWESFELPFPARRSPAIARLRHAWPWLLASAAATLVNPWGPKIYSSAFTLIGLRQSAAGEVQSGLFVGEFSRIPLSLRSLKLAFNLRNPDNGFWWLAGVAIVVVMAALWRRQFGAALIVAAATVAAFQHLRYQALFVITVAVLGARLPRNAQPLEALRSVIKKKKKGKQFRGEGTVLHRVSAKSIAFFALLAACVALACLRMADLYFNRYYVVSASIAAFGGGESWWFPERAADFIERVQLPGNIYEDYSLGGFAAWRLGPHYPDFIDGRGVSSEIFAAQQRLDAAAPDSPAWREAADRWNVNVLLFSISRFGGLGTFDLRGFCRSEEWRPVYMDEVSAVFVRNRPENSAWLEQLQLDCFTHEFPPMPATDRYSQFQYLANTGAIDYILGRFQEAQDALTQAANLYPFDAGVRLTMAQLFQQQGNAAAAEREYQESLERKETDVAWYALGRLYASEKRFQDAAQAIQKSTELAVYPHNNLKALGQVELRLQHPQEALHAFDEAERRSPFPRPQATSAGAQPQVGAEFNAQIAEGRAEAWRQMGNLSQAVESQELALNLTPQSPRRWEKLAELYEQAGQLPLAGQARSKARTLEAPAP